VTVIMRQLLLLAAQDAPLRKSETVCPDFDTDADCNFFGASCQDLIEDMDDFRTAVHAEQHEQGQPPAPHPPAAQPHLQPQRFHEWRPQGRRDAEPRPQPPPPPATPSLLTHSTALAQLPSASAGSQDASSGETDSVSSVHPPAQPFSPPRQQPAPWQRQLSSGISFGTSGGVAGPSAAAVAGGGVTTRAQAAQARSGLSVGLGPAASLPATEVAASASAAQAPSGSASGRAVPFTGRGFRLDGGSAGGSSGGGGGGDGAAGPAADGDEAISVPQRRPLRQRLPGRWAGRSAGGNEASG